PPGFSGPNQALNFRPAAYTVEARRLNAEGGGSASEAGSSEWVAGLAIADQKSGRKDIAGAGRVRLGHREGRHIHATTGRPHGTAFGPARYDHERDIAGPGFDSIQAVKVVFRQKDDVTLDRLARIGRAAPYARAIELAQPALGADSNQASLRK